jgi:hypothetical protein
VQSVAAAKVVVLVKPHTRFNRLTPSQRRRQSRRTGIYDNAGAFGWALNEHLISDGEPISVRRLFLR